MVSIDFFFNATRKYTVLLAVATLKTLNKFLPLNSLRVFMADLLKFSSFCVSLQVLMKFTNILQDKICEYIFDQTSFSSPKTS